LLYFKDLNSLQPSQGQLKT